MMQWGLKRGYMKFMAAAENHTDATHVAWDDMIISPNNVPLCLLKWRHWIPVRFEMLLTRDLSYQSRL